MRVCKACLFGHLSILTDRFCHVSQFWHSPLPLSLKFIILVELNRLHQWAFFLKKKDILNIAISCYTDKLVYFQHNLTYFYYIICLTNFTLPPSPHIRIIVCRVWVSFTIWVPNSAVFLAFSISSCFHIK